VPSGPPQGVPDPNLFVKQFKRSDAGQESPLPSDIRPPAVLKVLMSILLLYQSGADVGIENHQLFSRRHRWRPAIIVGYTGLRLGPHQIYTTGTYHTIKLD
jgi:hypothetical protein